MTSPSRRGPDYIAPVSTLSDVEARMGLPSIESLLAERDELVRDVALLRARHGPFGTWDNLRKIELSKLEAVFRAQAVAEGRKITEAAIDEAAHADPRYMDFVVTGTQEKARWFELENRIQGIADLINRGQAVARFLAAEVPLTPR